MNRTIILCAAAGASLGPGRLAIADDGARAYSADLMADAAGRTSFAEDNVVTVGGTLQFRYVADFRDEDTDDFTQGFQTRRTRVRFTGDVDGWGYQVQTDASRSSGSIGLLDAYVKRTMDNGWTVGFGQFKLPFWREENVSHSRQLAVERSSTNAVFTQDYSQGIWFGRQDEQFAFTGAISDGLRTRNTDFDSADEADFAITGRVDYLVVGEDWKRFKDFASWRGDPYTVNVGGAAHYQSAGDTNPEGGDMTFWGVTVDAQVEGDGWNAFCAIIWTSTDEDGSSDFDDLGALVQGGYFVSDQDELFARWDTIFSDEERVGAESTLNFLTVGYNHYFIPHSHAVKFTADAVWALNETLPHELEPTSTSNGLLGDDDEGELALRAQFQLLF